MEKLIEPPQPTEDSLLALVAKDIVFPNGRVMRVEISQWHWDLIAFIELWNDYYEREAGVLYEFHLKAKQLPDKRFSNAVMGVLRDKYNAWLEEVPTGGKLQFVDPRQ